MTDLSRRDVVRTLLSAAPFPLAVHRDAARLVRANLGPPGSGYQPRTFTPHQHATAGLMADMIIPTTDTPGAAAVGVHDFMDTILTEWFDQDETEAFLTGLDGVDAQSGERYQKRFVDASWDARHAIVTDLDTDLARRLAASAPLRYDFFYQFKRLTLTGYYTSEVGMTQELRWSVIPGAYRPCEPVEDLP